MFSYYRVMKKEIEIEIQVRIGSDKNLLKFLKKNAEFKYESYQKDEYFTPAHRDFIATKPIVEWLRLRDSNGKHSITYKNWKYTKSGKSRNFGDEYESELENLDKLKKIFKALDFKKVTTVEKTRKVWRYKDYEISVDSVDGLGEFVEIEHYGVDEIKTPEEITAEMIEFLKEIGCGKVEQNQVGYAYLSIYGEEGQFEEV